ncbi:MAG: 30S ribosomal protein S15 [Candidatus Methanomethyliaceae archaeon]|nr:30S ribosomal protein S15 [Candidatus Methanomethyliaceae archaeon]MDW7970398.1 30S ribosomal protein S15 [Nitrososphaerota archaeon]
MRKSKEKGKSHSTRPLSGMPKWVRSSPEEVEFLVVDLAKKGIPPSQIGMVLRDQYGIPLVKQITGKKICEILEEKGLAPKLPEDLANLIKRASMIRRHLEEHPKDMSSKRGLELVESKIKRLAKYYIKVGKLPSDWKYVPEKISILVK